MMDRKAWENLAAARLLLQGEEPCSNAAASRVYYAAYQACWAAMVEEGLEPPEVRPGSTYFPHADLPHEARQAGVLDERESQALADLYDLRVTADYYEDEDVTAEDVAGALQGADALVRSLLGEEAE
ncbi:MAG TPA: HEPN domain-containing protein [Archangium sp.]|nr:HEPN domain-containing protein [Archangium sp.]